MLGTFPPAPKRWSMAWYYPNFTNDMWRIFGLIFFGDKQHFVCQEEKDISSRCPEGLPDSERRGALRHLPAHTTDHGDGLGQGLEVVEQADLDGMLRALPCCRAVVTAGQLATQIFTRHYGIDTKGMKMGDYREFCFEGRTIRLYRMPSSSRAYPMRTEAKAAYYERMLIDLGIKTSNEQSNL